jgi:acetyl-CoA carboxylase carboxyl transferase subunit alpha
VSAQPVPSRAELERRLQEIEEQLARLTRVQQDEGVDLRSQIAEMTVRANEIREAVWRDPTPWQVVQVARHPQRPKLADYLGALFTNVTELHGDRLFADDPAMFCGLARFDGAPCTVIGHHKGKETRENIERRWGMPNPEGYRKAERVMRLAEKHGLPVISLVDTPAAYPGIEAEERGQAEAIAHSIMVMSHLRTPIVVAITGEGGSGGALGIAVGDRVLMMQYAIYSVIPPEGCAAILWHDASRKEEAAAALKLTAHDLLEIGLVDEIVPEPPGGAHTAPDAAIGSLRESLRGALRSLPAVPDEELRARRYEKYRRMGRYIES